MRTVNDDASVFIQRWQGVTASELSTSQSFVIELCGLLGVPHPHATAEQDYMFERPVTFALGDGSSSPGRIDCYRRGAFIWESKKLKPGSAVRAIGAISKAFDDALLRARAQAYALTGRQRLALYASGAVSNPCAASRSAAAPPSRSSTSCAAPAPL